MFIVTGGAGFIGSAVVWKLNTLGIHDIVVVDYPLSTTGSRNLESLVYREFVEAGQFLRMVEADQVPWAVEGIFHLGACSSTLETDVAYLVQNNFRYSRRLAQWSIDNQVRYIYASSAATYGGGEHGYHDDHRRIPRLAPMNLYGWSKQWMDLWALRTGAVQQMVGLKFFNVFGPNEYHKGHMSSVVLKAHKQIREKGSLQLFESYHPSYKHGQQCRDFVYVKDCVDAMWWLYEHREVNGIFNLGAGLARTWNDLAKAVFHALDLPVMIDYIPMPENLQKHYQYFTQADMHKLRRAGYDVPFRTLEEAVRDYVIGYLEQPQIYLDPRQSRASAAA